MSGAPQLDVSMSVVALSLVTALVSAFPCYGILWLVTEMQHWLCSVLPQGCVTLSSYWSNDYAICSANYFNGIHQLMYATVVVHFVMMVCNVITTTQHGKRGMLASGPMLWHDPETAWKAISPDLPVFRQAALFMQCQVEVLLELPLHTVTVVYTIAACVFVVGYPLSVIVMYMVHNLVCIMMKPLVWLLGMETELPGMGGFLTCRDLFALILACALIQEGLLTDWKTNLGVHKRCLKEKVPQTPVTQCPLTRDVTEVRKQIGSWLRGQRAKWRMREVLFPQLNCPVGTPFWSWYIHISSAGMFGLLKALATCVPMCSSLVIPLLGPESGSILMPLFTFTDDTIVLCVVAFIALDILTCALEEWNRRMLHAHSPMPVQSPVHYGSQVCIVLQQHGKLPTDLCTLVVSYIGPPEFWGLRLGELKFKCAPGLYGVGPYGMAIDSTKNLLYLLIEGEAFDYNSRETIGTGKNRGQVHRYGLSSKALRQPLVKFPVDETGAIEVNNHTSELMLAYSKGIRVYSPDGNLLKQYQYSFHATSSVHKMPDCKPMVDCQGNILVVSIMKGDMHFACRLYIADQVEEVLRPVRQFLPPLPSASLHTPFLSVPRPHWVMLPAGLLWYDDGTKKCFLLPRQAWTGEPDCCMVEVGGMKLPIVQATTVALCDETSAAWRPSEQILPSWSLVLVRPGKLLFSRNTLSKTGDRIDKDDLGWYTIEITNTHGAANITKFRGISFDSSLAACTYGAKAIAMHTGTGVMYVLHRRRPLLSELVSNQPVQLASAVQHDSFVVSAFF